MSTSFRPRAAIALATIAGIAAFGSIMTAAVSPAAATLSRLARAAVARGPWTGRRARGRARLAWLAAPLGCVLAAALGLTAPAASVAQASAAGHRPAAEPRSGGPARVLTRAGAPSSVPAPPTDAVGSPAASTVDRSDQLAITKVDNDTTTTADAGAAPDFSSNPAFGAESSRDLLNPQYPSHAGRFVDAYTDRTVAFKMVRAGNDGLFQLSSVNAVSEPAWPAGDAGAAPVAGGTFVLGYGDPSHSHTAADEPAGSPAIGTQVSDQPLAAASVPLLSQQWSLIPAQSQAGYFRLVNRSDGLCLDVTGGSTAPSAPVGSSPCGTTSGAGIAAQLWKPAPDDVSGIYTITNAMSGLLLTHGHDGAEGLTQTALPGSGDTPAQQWRFTRILEPEGANPDGATGPHVVDPMPTWTSPDVNTGADRSVPFAMAAGDLDRVVGDASNTPGDSQYHDEVAVAYTDASHRLQVRVIDYNANDGHLLATAPATQLPVVGQTIGGTYYPSSVGVAIGDFNGDDLNQIAVTWQNTTGFHVTFLTYSADGPSRTLTVTVADHPLPFAQVNPAGAISPVGGYADTAAGDFDGAGPDQLAVAYAAKSAADGSLRGQIGIAGFDAHLALNEIGTRQVYGPGATGVVESLPAPDPGPTWTDLGIRLAPGMLRYDPPNGWDSTRRELGVAWWQNDGRGTWLSYAQIVQASLQTAPAGCGLCKLAVTGMTDVSQETLLTPHGAVQPLSLTAGGFFNTGAPGQFPAWGLALAARGIAGVSPPPATWNKSHVIVMRADGNALQDTSVSNFGDPFTTGYVVTAYDRLGKSLMLGSPVVLTVTSLSRPTVIAAQPPAHVGWLSGRFINVSDYPGFNVTLSQSSGQSFTSNYQTTTASAIGVSEGFQSKNTVKAGLFGIASLGGSLSLGQTFSKEWDSQKSGFDQYSSTLTSTVTTTANNDDIVDGYLTTNYVYRYPVLGPSLTTASGDPVTTPGCQTDCQAYYEISVPGTTTLVNGAGRDYSWYQPSWQNGNALSYPTLDQAASPADLGPYTYGNPATGAGTTVTTPVLSARNFVGGNSTTDQLDITADHGAGTTRSSATTMKNGVDVKVGATINFNIGAVKVESKNTASTGFTDTSTESQMQTGETHTTSASSFQLNVPQIQANRAYEVQTTNYYTGTGVQKVIHGVDLIASAEGAAFWKGAYGQAPDPALNLPDSIVMTPDDLAVYDLPKWNNADVRQQIRGFAALQPLDPNSPLTSGQPYVANPQDGDGVTFAAEVHDYSLVEADNVPVDFYAVPVSPGTGAPIGAPQKIGGTVTIPKITPQGMTQADSPTWTAKGPVGGGDGDQDWRIFVLVDPANTLGEIHPLNDTAGPCPAGSVDPAPNGSTTLTDPMTGKPETLACGQNNQGYGQITVSKEPPRGPEADTPAAMLHLDGGGLLGGSPAAPRLPGAGQVPTVVAGSTVTGVIRAGSTADTDQPINVLVFDGPPAHGDLIADTTINGATAKSGGTATFTWQPTRPGRHQLYEELLGIRGLRNTQILPVTVTPNPVAMHSRRARG